MEFELQNCLEAKAALSSETAPNVRFYYTNKIGWMDEAFYKAEENTSWQTWTEGNPKCWSAVGFFFGRKLAEELGVTVGLIGCNWGGTSASSWIEKSILENDSELRSYVDDYEAPLKGKSVEEQIKEYDEYEIREAEWNRKAQKYYDTEPGIGWDKLQKLIGPNEWPGPKSLKNPFRPSGLYKCMLDRITPYTLKGVIWYQGESDDHKPSMYKNLFSKMIGCWRKDFQDEDLPFLFVQLPVHRYMQDKDFKHWCLIREAQEDVSKSMKNAFMTPALDQGAFNEIHPKQKKTVGERLSALALKNLYGKKLSEEEVFAPALVSFSTKGNRMELFFRNAESGFILKDDNETFETLKKTEKALGNSIPAEWEKGWTGFEIAGKDGKFIPAFFELIGNRIEVFNPEITEPVACRYAWYNYCPVNVFNKGRLPLLPFRTHRTEEKVSGPAGIQQIMTVAE